MSNIYKILKGTYSRRNRENGEFERFTNGDEVEMTDRQAERYGYNRLELIRGVSPGKKQKFVTQPKRVKEDEGEGEKPPAPEPRKATGASPAAVKFAQEHCIDITSVTPASADGKVTKTDVKKYLREQNGG